ncbi:hypothetical protein BTM25_12420 [Actinomadura rubteroloni]|uniref:Outer membrane channel protein CpnT-like N-terminal domain-containing protein n=1 Tax=Actinomadura rubteroloni TaxID=1926885 RepID=A0A2P4UP61_9ACTN|nr:hypothetical protein [Actinomadura rubteroloni]POM26834.1 hypothetical protein BTM25_12420 [Actinomadura rubteroloni]
MGLQLPGELISLLGYNWPEADETKLFQLGSTWREFSGTVGSVSADIESAAQRVPAANEGDDIEAFQKAWAAEDSPAAVLKDASMGATAVGAAFGASLAEIPIFKEITGMIIDELINQAITMLLG